MGLSGSTVWEVRIGGSDVNGGGFVTGSSGTDWSQQTSAQYSVTDGVTNGTTTITSATANFGTDVVGNIMYVSGGTGSVVAGWYQIVSRTNATTVVVDRTTGLTAGTGVTLTIGGALATPGQAASLINATGMHIWIKYSATTYDLTTATSNTPGGPMVPAAFSTSIEGYDVARGDRTGNRPTLRWTIAPGSLTYAIQTSSSARHWVANIKVDGNSQANAGGMSMGGNRDSFMDCVVTGCNQTGCIGFTCTGGIAIRCQSIGNTTGFNNGTQTACDASGGTTGYNSPGLSIGCLARGMATGFSAPAAIIGCTADSCTTAGFANNGNNGSFYGCLATNCSGVGAIGFNLSSNNVGTLFACVGYNNTTHVSSTPLINEGFITLAADPYVSQATGDFRPNANNPGGAQLWAAGIGVFGQINNNDLGAVQHSDPSAATYVINKMINNYFYNSPEP